MATVEEIMDLLFHPLTKVTTGPYLLHRDILEEICLESQLKLSICLLAVVASQDCDAWLLNAHTLGLGRSSERLMCPQDFMLYLAQLSHSLSYSPLTSYNLHERNWRGL
ncbi:hypothetical protein F2Q69_00061625 [Brassica cretica]|uniref:Uncharacterized protein n=1 Tax=Brassica cretica TaxID=69181 RepID=A0A8S9RL96_BRACR|nr:hypothetical protein F2Q69_00061625 [Brassica cretica]